MNANENLPEDSIASGETGIPDWADLNRQITACRLCPRLVEWRESVAANKRRAYREYEYWGKPVAGFGDPHARLLVVGLAPGAHGSNRTGRMFTGDASGEFLYAALHRTGFANQPTSVHIHDGLMLHDIFITAVARCAPPDNRPLPDEIRNCRPFLLKEISLLPHVQGIVALGRIAYDQITAIYADFMPETAAFSHGSLVEMKNGLPWLLASYHPSRQNTQTGRLTITMFDQIWSTARSLLN